MEAMALPDRLAHTTRADASHGDLRLLLHDTGGAMTQTVDDTETGTRVDQEQKPGDLICTLLDECEHHAVLAVKVRHVNGHCSRPAWFMACGCCFNDLQEAFKRLWLLTVVTPSGRAMCGRCMTEFDPTKAIISVREL